MFCPECGKENEAGSAHCANCGAALEDNQPAPKSLDLTALKATVDKVVQFVKERKVLLIPVAAIIVAVIVFCSVGSSISNPDRIVKGYVKNLIASNWSGAYKVLDLQESEFVSYEAYEAYQESHDSIYSEIKNYTVREDRADSYDYAYGRPQENRSAEDSLIKTYTVSYVTTGSSYEETFSVSLVKQDKKTMLFYPTYKVSASDIVRSYSIHTIEGAAVSVNGVSLEGGDKGDYSTVTYKIPAAFPGTYDLVVSYPECEDREEEIYIGSYSDSTRVDRFTLKEETKEELASATEDVFKSLCGSAISGGSYSLNVKEAPSSNVSTNFESMVSQFRRDDGTGLKSVDFKSFTDNSYQSELGSDLTYQCRMNFSYDYVKLELPWDSEEITEVPSGYTRDGNVVITYVYAAPSEGESPEWLISSINNYRLTY